MTRYADVAHLACRWDPANTRAWLIARLLLRRASPGGILVAHDGCAARAATLRALEIVLPELRRRGVAVVTLSQLAAAAEAEAAADVADAEAAAAAEALHAS